MKRTLQGMAAAGEPLLTQALLAIRAYNQAEAQGRLEEELKRLRLKADHLYNTVINYQLHKTGCLDQTEHCSDADHSALLRGCRAPSSTSICSVKVA